MRWTVTSFEPATRFDVVSVLPRESHGKTQEALAARPVLGVDAAQLGNIALTQVTPSGVRGF